MEDISSSHDLSDKVLPRREAELASLRNLSSTVASSLQAADVINAALDQIIIVLKPDMVFLFLRVGNTLDFAGSRSLAGSDVSDEMPLHEVGKCLCGLAVTQNCAVFSSDILSDSRCEWNDCKVRGIRSAAAIPLRTREGVLGVLTLASIACRDFELEKEFIETLAGHITVGINNALMYERIQKQSEIQQKLADEKIRLQAELEKQLERFRQVSESSGVWVWEIDASGLYQYSCSAVEKILGYSADAIVGNRNFTDFLVPDDKKFQDRDLIKAIAGREAFKELPVTKIHRDGSVVMLISSGFPMTDKNGAFTGYRGADMDVTARKNSEEALRRIQFAVETSRDAIFLVRRDAGLAYVNEAACKSLGYSKEELLTKTIFDIDPDVSRDTWDALWESNRNIKSYLIERTHITKYGRRFPVEISVNPISFEGKEYHFSYARDITTRKTAELSLQESELRFRTVVQNAEAIIFILDQNGVFLLSEGRALSKIGLRPGQVVGMSALQIYRDNPEVVEAVRKSLDGELTRLTNIVGGVIFDVVYSPYINITGKRAGVIGIAIDITERVRAEQQTDNALNFIRTMMASSPIGILSFKTSGEVVSANKEMARMFESTIDRLMSSNVLQLDECRKCGLIHLMEQALDASGLVQAETAYTGASGKTSWYEIRVVPFLHAGERHILSMFMDESERKKAEEEKAKLESQLLQAQKMEAIGTLAGGLAHDFNNILTGVLGYTSLMLTGLDKKSPFYEKLRIMENQIYSATDITKQLLGFARGGKYEILPTDLNRLVEQTSEMFGRTRHQIVIVRRLQADLYSVEVDCGQIEQVMLNLLLNAWQAMPEGGTLILQTENISLDEVYCIHHGVKPGSYVKLSVTDNGIGMDKEMCSKVFEPFFTTKDKGIGTGLGLASAYGIVRNHGGIINVYSEKGRGTTFTVYLPASGLAPVEDINIEDNEIIKGFETVLLIDDQQIVADVGKEMLEALGYEVLVARSGKEAIDIFSSRKTEIGLIILDMVMPGLGGGETFDRLIAIDPNARIILSSGYSMNGHAVQIMERGCRGFIQKPFSISDLSIKVRHALDE